MRGDFQNGVGRKRYVVEGWGNRVWDFREAAPRRRLFRGARRDGKIRLSPFPPLLKEAMARAESGEIILYYPAHKRDDEENQ